MSFLKLFLSALLGFLVAPHLSQADTLNSRTGTIDSECPHLGVAVSKSPGSWRRSDNAYQQSYREIFAAKLRDHGWKISSSSARGARPSWYLETQVLDPQDDTAAWSWHFSRQPTILDGVVHFPVLGDPENIIPCKLPCAVKAFNGLKALNQLRLIDYEREATVAAAEISRIFLPFAKKLCSEREEYLKRLQIQIAKDLEGG